ncbi:MAG: ROK family protein [Erysipelotrichaceae bacterium]
MKCYLGVDLGGTNIRVGKVSENGEILQVVTSPSQGDQGPEIVLENLYNLLEKIDDWKSCLGMGIGVPGPVDTETGTMTISTNLKGFKGFKLKDVLEEKLKMPVYLDNDANVAGLAEAYHGAGFGKKIVYYLTISTGIGGALIYNGEIISGRKGFAGEVANIIVDPSKEDNIFGLNKGAMEAESGGRALSIKAQEIFGDEIKHAGDFFNLVANKDEKALVLYNNFIESLATGIANVGHVVDPHVFVIGGGMLKSKEVWFADFVKRYNELVHVGMRNVEFKIAVLDEPGLIGAAMLPVSKGE